MTEERDPVRWRLGMVSLAVLTFLGLCGSAGAQFGIDPDPGNPVPVLIHSEGKMTLAAETVVSGDVHTNGNLVVRAGALVDGDASAVGSAQIQGSVTGTVTSPAAYRELPLRVDPSAARDLADQIYETDHDFIDATISGTVYVEGNARFLGTLSGAGMVIASGAIEVGLTPSATPGEPVPGMEVELSAYGSITILDSQAFRGSLDAGTDIVFGAGSWLMGAAVARGGTVSTGSGVRVVPALADTEPPALTGVSPPSGSWSNAATPTVSASYSDDLSGIDQASVRLWLDGVDRTPESIVGATEVSFTPATALSERFHTVEVEVSDLAGNESSSRWFFGVDVSAPALEFGSPPAEVVAEDSTLEAVVSHQDSHSGVDPASLIVELDGTPLSCQLVPDVARCGFSLTSSGEHLLVARAVDRAGNPAEVSHPFHFFLDLAPPVVSLSSPEDGAVVAADTVEVAGTVIDDGLVAEVEINGGPVTLAGDGFSVALPLAPGVNPVLVVATDTTGKQGFASASVTRDTVGPTLVVTRPTEGELTNQPLVRVAGSVDDDHVLGLVSVGGQPVAPGPDGEFEALVAVSPGASALTVRATDLAGNATEVTRTVVYYDVPQVEITSPPDLAELATTVVEVGGTVGDGVVSVDVNGIAAEISGDSFVASGVPLIEGGNTVTATAANAAGLLGTDTIHVVRDRTPPRVVIEHPLDGAVVGEASVAVWGLVHDIVPGTVNASEASVTVNGAPAEVANRSFRLAEVPLAPGGNSLVVTATDAAGNVAQAVVEVLRSSEPGARIRVVSGDGQTATVGQLLGAPLVVELLDGGGQPVVGETVIFKVKGGDGVLNGGARRIAVASDAAGRAQTTFTLGHRAGLGNQRVEALAVGYGGPAMFSAIALPASPAEIVLDAGGLQVGVTGQALPRPLIAVVTDTGRNRLAGVPVTFTVARGEGRFPTGEATITVETDSDGRAITPYVLGPEEGIGSDVVEARIAGLPGSPVVGFVASARAAGDPAETSISGVVLDNTSQPVEGVTVRVRGSALAVATDAQGQFRIPGAPVGSLDLLVDGSTAERPGAWPDLEFDLVTIPGRDNSVNTPIYLLPIDLGSALAVSETTGGTLRLPDLPGFALEVSPGSVTFPSGGHSGIVSVTAVHYDKVPMTPNFGQQPRLIVTIQPAGARFEPPARMTLPNVEGLAPGAVTEMYSFDHDLGHFVSIGPATVSEDGATLTSNLGVGIVKAGWHCGGDPAVSGAPHACPPCMVCSGTTCVPGCPLPAGGASAVPGSEDRLFEFATSCACDDGDSCTVNDQCDGVKCTGDAKQILSLEALPMPITAKAGEIVAFLARIEEEHCDDVSYLWEFGDGATSTGQQTAHVYDEPGVFNVKLEAECGDCDVEMDMVAVSVKCTDVKIVSAEPDLADFCPGCEVQYTAETDPPDRQVFWRSEGTGPASVDSNGLLTIGPTHPGGLVEVTVSTVPDFSACTDSRQAQVFVPEGRPIAEGEWTDRERAWIAREMGLLVGEVRPPGPERVPRRQPPSCLLGHFGIKDHCREAAKSATGSSPLDNTSSNAFYHAYCACRSASLCDAERAQELWDGHEDHENNPCKEAIMDLWNDEVGIGLSTGDKGECFNLIKEALDDGRLRWIKFGGECPTYTNVRTP